MLGAIAGDVIGSVHEFIATKSTDFELFVAKSRLHGRHRSWRLPWPTVF